MEMLPSILLAVLSIVIPMKSILASQKSTNKGHKLILFSLDGFRWDYLNGRAKTPTFDFMKQHGVFAREGVQTVYLSNTLPVHFSLVTGLHPESHGMVDNVFYDPLMKEKHVPEFYDGKVNPKVYDGLGEPIWVSHKKQNQGRSGVFMWMGGEEVIGGVRPDRYFPYTETMDEIDEMNVVFDWLTDNDDIDLAIVYIPQPDITAHLHGLDSKQVTEKIEYLDKAVGHLLKRLENHGILNHTDLIVTSDHGFTATPPEKSIFLDEILDMTSFTTLTGLPNGAMSIFPEQGKENEVYSKLKAAADSSGVFNVYRRGDIPERFHYKQHRRIPPIFAAGNMGYSFVTKDTQKGFDILRGNHGYDNFHKDMRPFFVAFGPSFKKGYSVETFDSIDIYSLMCHIKGIEPLPNNGSMAVVGKLLHNQPFQFEIPSLFICVVIIAVMLLLFISHQYNHKGYNIEGKIK